MAENVGSPPAGLIVDAAADARTSACAGVLPKTAAITNASVTRVASKAPRAARKDVARKPLLPAAEERPLRSVDRTYLMFSVRELPTFGGFWRATTPGSGQLEGRDGG